MVMSVFHIDLFHSHRKVSYSMNILTGYQVNGYFMSLMYKFLGFTSEAFGFFQFKREVMYSISLILHNHCFNILIGICMSSSYMSNISFT